VLETRSGSLNPARGIKGRRLRSDSRRESQRRAPGRPHRAAGAARFPTRGPVARVRSQLTGVFGLVSLYSHALGAVVAKLVLQQLAASRSIARGGLTNAQLRADDGLARKPDVGPSLG
jgi:hypothetical protein